MMSRLNRNTGRPLNSVRPKKSPETIAMWFTETPWPPIVILVTVAIVLAGIWSQNQRSVFLLGILGLLAGAVAVFVVERQIVTETERVEANIHAMVDAAVRGNVDEVLAFISPQENNLRRIVQFGLDQVDIEDDARVTDATVQMTTGGTQAISRFRVNATINIAKLPHHGHHPSRWEMTWRRVGKDWKVFELRRLNPVTGEPMDVMERQE